MGTRAPCSDRYVVDAVGAAELQRAAWRLHHMALEAVERVVASDELLAKCEIPPALWPAVRASRETAGAVRCLRFGYRISRGATPAGGL